MAYSQERFPLGAYGLLVGVFTWSALSVSAWLSGGPGPGWEALPAGVVVLLVFFHIRVFDEHKDHDEDRRAHPDRLLSRGVVTLPLLARLGAAAAVVQLALAALLGPRAFVAWLVVAGFTVLMRVEFGVGRWLRARMLAYAFSHNPVVALLALFLWAASGEPWDVRYLGFVGFVSLAMLGFEVGRKLHLPQEENIRVPSYSSVYGRGTAVVLLCMMELAAVTSGVLLLGARDTGSLFDFERGVDSALVGEALMVAAGAVAFVLLFPRLPGKKVELISSLVLLLGLVALGLPGC